MNHLFARAKEISDSQHIPFDYFLPLIKETTLKISLTNGTDLIKFGSNQEEYDKLYSDLGCVTINVVGECKANVWNRLISPQIEIKEYDIVGTTEYYF